MTILKNILLAAFTVVAFTLLMMINLTTGEGLDISLCGENAIAQDSPCNDPEEEDYFYYNNIDPEDPDNCLADGDGCLTCTAKPIEG